MTTEAKVGAFTLLGLALFGFILVYLGNIKVGGDKDYTIYAGFNQVMGLSKGSSVRYAGVAAGQVVSLEPDGVGVRVGMKLHPDIKVPRASKISISSSGLMGEKLIVIMPEADNGDYLKDGDYVIGVDEKGMESMIEGLNVAVSQVHELLTSINEVMGDPKVKGSVIEMAVNMRDVTANIKTMTAALSRMAVNNEDDVRNMARNMSQMTASLMRSADTLEQMMQDFSGDGQTAANLKVAVANLSAASQRIENMAANIEGVVADPQTAEDLRVTLHNARQVSERANKMMSGAGGMKMETGIDTMYSGKNSDWMTNFDMSFYMDPNSFLLLGVDDIGEGNKFNGQVGKRSGDFGGRIGAIDSKPGIGLDAYAGDKWKFSVDAYDMNHATMKLRAQYQVTSDTYIVGQMNAVNRRDDRASYIGIRHTF